jgi:hypothetical protein
MTNEEQARLAYHIATGRTLDDRDEAARWALSIVASASPLPSFRRAVEAMIPWLDSVVADDDTRSRLGLADLAWTIEDGWLWLTHEGATVARVCDFGWAVWMPGESHDFAGDAEDGTAGMDAAEAALRRAGVLAEGVTVRRAVTL